MRNHCSGRGRAVLLALPPAQPSPAPSASSPALRPPPHCSRSPAPGSLTAATAECRPPATSRSASLQHSLPTRPAAHRAAPRVPPRRGGGSARVLAPRPRATAQGAASPALQWFDLAPVHSTPWCGSSAVMQGHPQARSCGGGGCLAQVPCQSVLENVTAGEKSWQCLQVGSSARSPSQVG